MSEHTTEVHVSGTEKFRRVALFGSLIFGAITAVIMLADTSHLKR